MHRRSVSVVVVVSSEESSSLGNPFLAAKDLAPSRSATQFPYKTDGTRDSLGLTHRPSAVRWIYTRQPLMCRKDVSLSICCCRWHDDVSRRAKKKNGLTRWNTSISRIIHNIILSLACILVTAEQVSYPLAWCTYLFPRLEKSNCHPPS